MDLNSEDALFETLTLNREIIMAEGPPYGGYGGAHLRWGWGWGKDTKMEIWTNHEGVKHRIYGPAVTSVGKYLLEEWWKDGVLHRVAGPARTHNIHNKFWYKEGKLHNLGGPAVIELAGPKQYWIEGSKLSPKEYKKEIARRIRKGLIK